MLGEGGQRSCHIFMMHQNTLGHGKVCRGKIPDCQHTAFHQLIAYLLGMGCGHGDDADMRIQPFAEIRRLLYGENLRLQYMLGNIAIQKHSLMQRENLRSAFPWKE